jgi:inhibitor of cysteine peptidase
VIDAASDRRTRRRIGAALRFGVVLGLCALLAACAVVAPPREVDVASDNSHVVLGPQQELVVRLAANPSTGYRWVVERNANLVLSQGDDPNYEPVFASAPLVGSGGWTTFHYRASAIGTDTLELAYRRTWETGAPPARTFRLEVVVAKP